MRRTPILLAVGASALALAGCGPDFFLKPPKGSKSVLAMRTVTKLDCPAKQGELTLVKAAADGKSCDYTGPDAEVTLKLVSLNGGDAQTALSPIETELKALMPETVSAPAKAQADADGGDGRANIDLPGVHIRADDHGAQVRVGGVNIDANDDRAEVRVSQNVTVSESDEGRTVSVKDDGGNVEIDDSRSRKRMRHGNHMKGIRATYMLATGDEKVTPPGAYRVVGYEARGPKDGPLAVAVVKSKQTKDSEGDLFDDAKSLVIHNVGPGSEHIRID